MPSALRPLSPPAESSPSDSGGSASLPLTLSSSASWLGSCWPSQRLQVPFCSPYLLSSGTLWPRFPAPVLLPSCLPPTFLRLSVRSWDGHHDPTTPTGVVYNTDTADPSFQPDPGSAPLCAASTQTGLASGVYGNKCRSFCLLSLESGRDALRIKLSSYCSCRVRGSPCRTRVLSKEARTPERRNPQAARRPSAWRHAAPGRLNRSLGGRVRYTILGVPGAAPWLGSARWLCPPGHPPPPTWC